MKDKKMKINENRYQNIIYNILSYAESNHMDGIERSEIIDELIGDGDITEDELKIIDDGVYEEYLEWKKECEDD